MTGKKLSSFLVSTATTKIKNRKPTSPAPNIAAFNKRLDPFHFNSSPPPPSSGSKPACASPVVSDQVLSRLKEAASRSVEASQPSAEDSAISFSDQIAYILSSGSTDGINRKEISDGSGSFNMCQVSTEHWKKELNRERKHKFIFKNAESHRFKELMKKCANIVGTQPTLGLFEKLGRETDVKEYYTLINISIDEARKCNKDEDALVHINKVYGFLLSMREKGLQIEEESYDSLLMYMIDMKLTQEFQMFSEFLKNEDLESSSRISYYEMLLWIRVGNEDKIRELLDCVNAASTKDRLALAGAWLENVSLFIYEYTTCVPKLAVEDVVSKFISFHQKLGIVPSVKSYEKLVTFSSNLHEFHAALDTMDHMCKSGLNVPNVLKTILQTCEQCGELEMVHHIYSLIRQHNIKPGVDIFKNMIGLCTKMKDFEHAYNMLADVVAVEKPTASMFNAIMAGYFRKKNNHRALMVLKQMEDADVKPDAETFSYLIANCESEEDIIKAASGWLHIVPWGIRKLMNYIKENYENPLVIITENGMDDPNNANLYKALKDDKRIQYHSDYLSHPQAAIWEDGCNVRGYFVWSLLDNWEWNAGYTVRFGLYYVDYKNNLTRIPKASAHWFKNVLGHNLHTQIIYS